MGPTDPQLPLEELHKLKEHLSHEEYLEILYQHYPSLWIEEYIPDPIDTSNNITLRYYQRDIVNTNNKKKVIRMGRQVGKTRTLVCVMLYFAIKRSGSRIICIGPQKIHVQRIYGDLTEAISNSSYIASYVKSHVKQPIIEITFINGNMIRFYTTGESSGGEGTSIRGETASVLLVDEADYINDDVMQSVVIPTTSSFEYPYIYLSSTPSGRKGFFRTAWDSGYYSTFHVKSSDGPTWNAHKEAETRATTTKRQYSLEYDAEWADSESGVFSKEDMRECTKLSVLPFPNSKMPEGIEIRPYTYEDTDQQITELITPKCKILGVDWNKAPNGTRMVWVDFDNNHVMHFRRKWNIDVAEFTQNVAMQKIIELHTQINFDFIMVDVGFGNVHIEDLHLHGLQHPHTRLDKIVIGVHTEGQIDIRDIATYEQRKTPVKNFLVESLVRYLEQHRIRIPHEEKMYHDGDKRKQKYGAPTIFDQMVEYIIARYTPIGRPVYACKTQDHDLSALMFTLYGYLTEVIKTHNLIDNLPIVEPKSVVGSIIQRMCTKTNVDKPDWDFKNEDILKKIEKQNSVYVEHGIMKRTLRMTTNRNSRTLRSNRSLGRSF